MHPSPSSSFQPLLNSLLFSTPLPASPSPITSVVETDNATNSIETDFSTNAGTRHKANKTVKEQPNPSKVVHGRNLPTDMTEKEISQVAKPFGRVVDMLLLKGKNKTKNQVFIELESIEAATNLVNHYNIVRVVVRGNPIFFQYSTHSEIFTTVVDKEEESQSNSILLITFSNVIHPITIELLHRIFAKYGEVLKIIKFSKNDTLQSFVEFANVQQAEAAKAALDSKNIYPDCCGVRIKYSQLKNLNVEANNEKSRDFTNPNLPTTIERVSNDVDKRKFTNAKASTGPSISRGAANQHNYNNSNHNNHAVSNYRGLTSWIGPNTASTSSTNSSGGNGIFQHSNNSGNYYHNNSATNNNNNNPTNNNSGAATAGSLYVTGNNSNTTQHRNTDANNNYNNNSRNSNNKRSNVLIVNGLPDNITPDELFTLFSVYGDVIRVKILYSKKDTALIQFVSSPQASTAMANLNDLHLRGQDLKVNYSKISHIQLPREATDLTKDFSDSPLHRYKVAGSKNYHHITAPSPVLHLSNLHPDITQEQIESLFSPFGEISSFNFFPMDKKMALISFQTVEEAVEALIKMHNFSILNQNIRVSFSSHVNRKSSAH